MRDVWDRSAAPGIWEIWSVVGIVDLVRILLDRHEPPGIRLGIHRLDVLRHRVSTILLSALTSASSSWNSPGITPITLAVPS